MLICGRRDQFLSTVCIRSSLTNYSFDLLLWKILKRQCQWCNGWCTGLHIKQSLVCSCARHLTLTVPLNTQVYSWYLVNSVLGAKPATDGGEGDKIIILFHFILAKPTQAVVFWITWSDTDSMAPPFANFSPSRAEFFYTTDDLLLCSL